MSQPLHRLSVRYGGSSGSARPFADPDSDAIAALKSGRTAVIFIHGFANTEPQATKKFEQMKAALERLTRYERGLDHTTDYFGFHWPGNHRLIGWNQLTFATRIGVASDSGNSLANTLLRHAHGRVILVAHSLGCRVALKCLSTLLESHQQYPDRPTVQITNVVLMAAAVSWRECIPETDRVFGQHYPGSRTLTLHSGNDAVLFLGFPAGQAQIDAPGRAVGRWGQPFGDRWDRRVPTNLGHGGYWKSDRVANEIARDLPAARRSAPLAAATIAACEPLGQVELPFDDLPVVAAVGG